MSVQRVECRHIMFALERNDPRGGQSSAYFLTVENTDDLPPDAISARVLHVGDLVYIETDGRVRNEHAHNTGTEIRTSQFGYPWAETTRVEQNPVAAWIYRLQNPPIPD